MVQMIAERADIEKTYSKNLKAWSKKWNEYLTKGSEYGTMRTTWSSALVEAEKIADIHLQTNNVLNEEYIISLQFLLSFIHLSFNIFVDIRINNWDVFFQLVPLIKAQ